MKPSLKISKLDAAKRQLETVIRLYFSDCDPVSIHTLTAAAYNVIRDVSDKRHSPRMIVKGVLVNSVKPNYQKTFRCMLNEAENFFKHANEDLDATLDFDPEQSEILILDACWQYLRLTGEWPPLFGVYQAWYVANRPRYFTLMLKQADAVQAAAPDAIALGKQGFFNTMLPLAMRIHT